jgi:hypothetical protein
VGRIAQCMRPRGCMETPLLQLEFLEPQLQDFLVGLCWSFGREVGQLEGLQCREGGTLAWVVHIEGNKRLLVVIVAEVWYLGLDTIFYDC